MRVLVVGAAGQVGSSLATELLPIADLKLATRAELDLSNPGGIHAFVAAARPDVVFNAAAYTAVDRAEAEPELAFTLNAAVPGALADACSATGARLVHFSTDYVFDGTKDEPYVETDATEPLSVYGKTKLEGERQVLARCDRALVIRTSWVFSPTGTNFVRTILRLARERDALRVVHDQVGCPTPALLLAQCCLVMLARHGLDFPAGVRHLAGAEACSFNDLAREVVRLARRRDPAGTRPGVDDVARITTAEYPTAATRPRNSRLDSTRFARELGLRLPGYRPYLERMLESPGA